MLIHILDLFSSPESLVIFRNVLAATYVKPYRETPQKHHQKCNLVSVLPHVRAEKHEGGDDGSPRITVPTSHNPVIQLE